MDEFEYIMVLVSIIMGLGIAHILFGLGDMIDRLTGKGPELKLGLAHGAWLGAVFAWMVMFWWWEFRFSELDVDWTVGLYLFLVGYAMGLFLLAVILVPRSWDGVHDLDEFFIQRRVWFYSLLLLVTGMDIIDGYLKGGFQYLVDNGPWVWSLWFATVPIVVIGIKSEKPRHHAVMGGAFLLWQFIIGFGTLRSLGM